jgi:hypothetical protein
MASIYLDPSGISVGDAVEDLPRSRRGLQGKLASLGACGALDPRRARGGGRYRQHARACWQASHAGFVQNYERGGFQGRLDAVLNELATLARA